MAEKQCPFCCEKIESYLQKCPYCGEILDVTCPYCGNVVSAKAKICPHCSREIIPKPVEKNAPWAIVSMVMMFFFCAICIGTCICIFDTSPTGIPNLTIDEKLKNIGDILFIFLFPLLTSIVACCKKQNIAMAVISLMVSVVFSFFTILIIITGNV